MGGYATINVCKGVVPDRLLGAFGEVSRALMLDGADGERIDCRFVFGEDVQCFAIHPFGRDWWVRRLLVKRLDCRWISAHVQEGSLWEFGLMHGERSLGKFSTWPEYWGHKQEPDRKIREFAKLFAEIWDIPLERFERYLLPWGKERVGPGVIRSKRKGKAYPTDAHDYGDPWQLREFVMAIGAKDPNLLLERPDRVVPVYFPSDEELARRTKQVAMEWFGET